MATSASKPTDQQEVTIRRQQDGRHAVMDQYGNVLGLHNSPVSAARQVSSYFGQPTAEPMEPGVIHTLANTQHPAPTNADLAAGMAYGAALQQQKATQGASGGLAMAPPAGMGGPAPAPMPTGPAPTPGIPPIVAKQPVQR